MIYVIYILLIANVSLLLSKFVNFNNNIFLFLLIASFILIIINNYLFECQLNNAIDILVRQAARWTTAAEQDENPIIANLHANYGAGYIFALRSIATDNQIKLVTNKDAKQLENYIIKVQENILRNLIKQCPNIAPKGKLAKIGGEAI